MSTDTDALVRELREKQLRGIYTDFDKRARQAADTIERLTAEAASFHMAYRMKCDEETKAQAVEIERLIRERDEAVARERERCAQLCESARPAGGRAWSPEQSACFEALTHVAAAIRTTKATN